jgi:CrcB protein
MKDLLIVGLGGGIGSICRYGLNVLCQKFFPSTFPLGTFAANILGCLLIGAFLGLFYKQAEIPKEWYLLGVTGFCGGFTTFSTFSSENLQMLQQGSYALSLTYIAASVVLGLLAVMLGFYLAK